MAFTWTDMLDDLKVRGAIPTSTNNFSEARLLSLTNAILKSRIVPKVLKVHEGYYSYDVDNTLGTNSNFLIPSRAVGGKLQDVAFINGTQRFPAVPYLEKELQDTTQAPSNDPGIYLKRNRIFVVPSDGGGWPTLRMTILIRPNKIVATTSAAQITAINTGTKTLTFTTVPTTWTNANIFDLVQANPHFDWLAIDQVVTTVVTGALGTITFSSTLPVDLAVGDWVSLAGQTPIIQCPEEFHPLLAQLVANTYLKAKGDSGALKLGLEEAKEIEDDVMTVINPRIERKGKKINNRTGLLRRGG